MPPPFDTEVLHTPQVLPICYEYRMCWHICRFNGASLQIALGLQDGGRFYYGISSGRSLHLNSKVDLCVIALICWLSGSSRLCVLRCWHLFGCTGGSGVFYRGNESVKAS